MAYTYDPINHSLIDMDLKIPEEKKKPVPKKPVLKDPVRKPNAVPPKPEQLKWPMVVLQLRKDLKIWPRD